MNNRKKSGQANLITLLIIPIAIAINFIGSNLAAALKLPVYLDTIGTFMVSMLAGPWVGAAAGGLGNLISGVMTPTLLPYTFGSILCGLIGGYLARMGMFVNFKRFIVALLAVILVCVGINIATKMIFFGGYTPSSTSAMCAAMVSVGTPFPIAVVITTFIGEVPDKIISLLIPYIVIHRMPDRFLYNFANGSVFITERKRNKKE